MTRGRPLKDYPSLLNEWDYEVNLIDISSLRDGSNQKVGWVCSKNHLWNAVVSSRTRQGNGCPICAGRYPEIGVNDLKTTHRILAEEFHPHKNVVDISSLKALSNRKVWWLCAQGGHEFEASVAHRTKELSGCPYCSGRTAISGKNDLGTLFPNLTKEWSSRNIDSPSEYLPRSNKEVWWVCPLRGHEYMMVVDKRTDRGSGCPNCRALDQTSAPENYLCKQLKLHFKDTQQSVVLPVGWGTSKSASVDMLIPQPKSVVEYDGAYWHKERTGRDLLKTKALIREGYRVVRVREYPLTKLPTTEGLHQLRFNPNSKDYAPLAVEITNYLRGDLND